MSLTTLEDYVKREIFKTDKELFDFCPACDETGNTVEALMKGLFQEAKKLQKQGNSGSWKTLYKHYFGKEQDD